MSSALARMRHPRAALQQWWLARRRPVEVWTLTQRNIYIVPTRAGLAFGATLLLLLVASINYQLNLGYALTFLLAGSALASMHMTHGSLRGLSLHLKPVAPTNAGHSTPLEVIVTNPGHIRHGLNLGLLSENPVTHPTWATAAAQAQTTVVIALQASQRGRHALPPLRLETRFPFGLFRAWTVWQPAGDFWVYPRLETPAAALPPAEALPGNGAHRQAVQGAEFDGVRPWRLGDSQRQVVWKKVARSGQLVSRDQHSSQQQQLWLDWQHTHLADPEARLSRLAAWVLAAKSRHLPFGLRLPGRTLPMGEGEAQQQLALQALAEWGHP